MKTLYYATLALILLSGCSTVRTKYNDKTLRVLVWPAGISADHYVQIQNSLMRSGKFRVIDRGDAFLALKNEQDREHVNEADRFEDKEKFSHYGKLWGVGSIIVSHAECMQRDGGLFKQHYPTCREFLSIVDSNTGEIVATAMDEADGGSNDYDLVPSWDGAVEKLVEAYPRFFEGDKDDDRLKEYKALSAQEAAKMAARKPAGKE